MRRWLRFGLVDLLVAIVLVPPGVVLAFQTTLLLLGGGLEPGFAIEMTKLDGPIVVCDRSTLTTVRERLLAMKLAVEVAENELASGEFDATTRRTMEERIAAGRSEIDRLELKLAAQDFLRQPYRDEFRFASEGSR